MAMSGPPRAIWSATSCSARSGVSGWVRSRSSARVRCADRLARGAPLRGDLAGERAGTGWPGRVAAALEVHGQLGRRLAARSPEAGLEPLADPAMQLHPACRPARARRRPPDRARGGSRSVRPPSRPATRPRHATSGTSARRARSAQRALDVVEADLARRPPRRRRRTPRQRRSPPRGAGARRDARGRARARSSGGRLRGSRSGRASGRPSTPSARRARPGRRAARGRRRR